MTTGHRIELKTFRIHKRLKKTALNTKITYKSFRDKSIKILSIPTFIDNSNYYIEGVDQLNQLRASVTSYFARN
jgi:hypothetical protein